MHEAEGALVRSWVTTETERIRSTYGVLLDVRVLQVKTLGDVLFRILDPVGSGTPGEATLHDVRLGASGEIEFSVFLRAHAELRKHRPVHLWGVDVRRVGSAWQYSTDGPWLPSSGEEPMLRSGIDRLVEGRFEFRRLLHRDVAAEPYGGA